ncbi:MAG: molybdate ABC transporter substrate-binding protein, partial [Ghiorsea sp.]|nr:molybdate ABC transporter substrate-binding protein [Ghiorsea sp.]
AVASSFYSKAQQMSEAFETKHDIKIRIVSGSTGRLYNQIKQGAPFDIFIAADIERPALLAMQHKQIDQGFVGLKIKGKLVSDLKSLLNKNIRHIAMANPDVAPFGLATKQVLQQAGLWQSLQAKLVYAQNAMQTAMMVNQGLVDAGFIPIADKTNALATVPYVAVLLSHTKSAQMFYDFLGSELLTLLGQRDDGATEVVLPSGSEALASPSQSSLRKYPRVLASPHAE